MTPERIAAIIRRAQALVGRSAYCFATAQGRGLPPLTVVGPWPPFGEDSRGQCLLGLSPSMRVDAEGGAWRYWLELGE